MADLTAVIERSPWPEGMNVGPADLINIDANVDNTAGRIISLFGGPNIRPQTNPLLVVPHVSGMFVDVGGTAQWVIAQGWILDVCPLTTLAVDASIATDRVDLIAIKATAVPGAVTLNRNVRADNAATGQFTSQAQLVLGRVTVAFPAGYTAAPLVWVTPNGTATSAGFSVVSSPTQVVITSSDPNDARIVNVLALGAVTAVGGVPTPITQLEKRPAVLYVAGNNAATPPATPGGYEAFASLRVRANVTSMLATDVTYLFPPPA